MYILASIWYLGQPVKNDWQFINTFFHINWQLLYKWRRIYEWFIWFLIDDFLCLWFYVLLLQLVVPHKEYDQYKYFWVPKHTPTILLFLDREISNSTRTTSTTVCILLWTLMCRCDKKRAALGPQRGVPKTKNNHVHMCTPWYYKLLLMLHVYKIYELLFTAYRE